MIIRWIRLQNILDDIFLSRGLRSKIYASNSLPSNLIAGVGKNGLDVAILLNLNENKSEHQIIESLAHEIAHILNNNNTHDSIHQEKCLEIKLQITKLMGKE